MTMTFCAYKLGEGSAFDIAGPKTVSVSNFTAGQIAQALRLEVTHSEVELVPVQTAIDRCIAYLRARVGNPDPALPPLSERAAGQPTVMFLGRSEGFLQRTVAEILDAARAGAQCGATHFGGG